MTPVRLDIFSDPVCPWCYVGKANLDRALEAAADHPFVVQWHPFQLNPDMPPEGVDKRGIWKRSSAALPASMPCMTACARLPALPGCR